MQRAWLHCIGKRYYPTRESFLDEADEYGITRRVSLRTLAKMNWGDTIICAHKDGKTLVTFRQFAIGMVSGLSRAALTYVLSNVPEGATVVLDDRSRGELVNRGCGSFAIEDTFEIDLASWLPLSELAQLLQAASDGGVDVGMPMVGASDHDPLDCGPQLVRLKDVPHRMGFRQFNLDEFVGAANKAGTTNGRLPAVHGQFYVWDDDDVVSGWDGAVPIKIQSVRKYTKRENATIKSPEAAIVDEL